MIDEERKNHGHAGWGVIRNRTRGACLNAIAPPSSEPSSRVASVYQELRPYRVFVAVLRSVRLPEAPCQSE